MERLQRSRDAPGGLLHANLRSGSSGATTAGASPADPTALFPALTWRSSRSGCCHNKLVSRKVVLR
jgi:hypothetical protein